MARIVVVDDSKLMRGLLRGILEQAGHEVDAWEEVSALEVTERIGAHPPDLVLTDYQMPGCNGLTVLKMARKAKPGLPVVVLTSSRDPAVEEVLNRQEVSCILHKPLKPEALLAVLAKVL
jgi:two-component system, chemotaxis family, chemotaxis protein CheY